MLNFLATFCYGLAGIFGYISIVFEGIAEFCDEDRTPETDSKLCEIDESERRRYEIRAAATRLVESEATRPARSRALEGELVEVWLP